MGEKASGPQGSKGCVVPAGDGVRGGWRELLGKGAGSWEARCCDKWELGFSFLAIQPDERSKGRVWNQEAREKELVRPYIAAN